jgi:hypothetical protein
MEFEFALDFDGCGFIGRRKGPVRIESSGVIQRWESDHSSASFGSLQTERSVGLFIENNGLTDDGWN